MKLWQTIFRSRRPVGPHCSALIAAAGSSHRMAGENKLLLPLGGKPVLAHTLQAVDAASGIREIIIAAREEDLEPFAELCKTWGIKKPVKVVIGGATREESVLRAATEADPDADLLAVQDGARPFVTPELIDAVIEQARIHYAAAPALPVKDTIKIAADGVVRSTPDRSLLYAVQTPQVFDAQLLRAALHSAIGAGAVLTDDCSAVERFGKEVHLTPGLDENIKITTPLDMILAEAILANREG
ncbi:MAG: 2-C-methyl-D-erythritol 4-phosphate cytidylyltransferase [Oscillospiraceae bacterium]|nr:2-C-methyl-D-erythritol 4-phosphate cytidylyltransferase [Oscillospiraceae bacterium]